MFPIEYLFRAITRLVKNWWRRSLEEEALGWPRATGTVMDTRTERSEGGAPWHDWSVRLIFSYVADGEYYSGDHLLPPESQGEADEIASRWRGRSLVVRYSPNDASRSVVLLQEQPDNFVPTAT